MVEARPPSGSSSGGAVPPAEGRLRVLVVQSALPPLDAVPDAWPTGRFDVTFARDALTVVASVSAREVDVVLLDTPLFDVDIDALLRDLERQRSGVPVLVLGGPRPARLPQLSFVVRHLRKPIEAEPLRQEVEAVVRETEHERSLPPPQSVRGESDAADFLEWSQLAMELAEATVEKDGPVPADAAASAEATVEKDGPLPADAAASAEATVEIPGSELAASAEATVARAGAVSDSAEAMIETDGPAGAPRRRDSSRPPSRRARGVDLERALTIDGPDAAPPPLAGRTAAIVGRRVDVATRISLALYAAGVEVRILEGGLGDVLPQLREVPPDLVVVDAVDGEDVERAQREFRAEVRLWHRPLLLVAADAELETLLRTAVPGGPDAVVRADAAEAELVAKAGFLLAPAEQVRDRMLREKVAAGEIGPVGVATLVRLAAAARPEGRLVLRGEGRLAELDLRGPEIVQARLTEPDGRQLAGEEALAVAMTLRSGRYSLRPPPIARPFAALHLPIPQALWDAADRLSDLIRRAAPDRLPRVRRLRLRDRSGPILGLSSVELRARERLQTGDAPRVLAGAPGFDAELVARLVEKLVLCGDVVDVEADDGALAEAPEVDDAAVEVLDAAAVEELPSAVPPPHPPSAVRTLFGMPRDVAVRSPSVPAPAPPVVAAAAAPLSEPPPAVVASAAPSSEPPPIAAAAAAALSEPPPVVVAAAAPLSEPPPVVAAAAAPLSEPPPPEPLSPPVFGVLPSDLPRFDDAGPGSPGLRGAVPDSPVAEPRIERRRRPVAAWLIPIALLAAGVGVLAVLYGTGRLGDGRSGASEDVGGRSAAEEVGFVAVAAQPAVVAAGRTDATASASSPEAVESDAGSPPETTEPDAAPSVPESVEPDVVASSSETAGPDAASGFGVGAEVPVVPDAPVAEAEPAARDAGVSVPEPVGRSDGAREAGTLADGGRAPTSREAGTSSGGPAVLVVPRPEGVTADLVVFVDGVRRGVAPVRVELPAGEHELRFEAAGRQSLSLVRLRSGERKTVVPRQLVRQLQTP
ncbi:MAG: hypothetical protein JXB32_16880 [Deltaproteobacteria bacterium]|nr:hypothetical protein [Deltaproteobacteria bacterium]